MHLRTAARLANPVLVAVLSFNRGFDSYDTVVSMLLGTQLTSVLGLACPLLISLYFIVFSRQRFATVLMAGLLIVLAVADIAAIALGFSNCGCVPGFFISPIVSGVIAAVGALILILVHPVVVATVGAAESDYFWMKSPLRRIIEPIACANILVLGAIAISGLTNVIQMHRTQAVVESTFNVQPTKDGTALIVVKLKNDTDRNLELAGVACVLPLTTAVGDRKLLVPGQELDVPILIADARRSGVYTLQLYFADYSVVGNVQINIFNPIW